MISGSDAGAHLPRHARWWPQRPIAGLCRGSSSTPDIDHCVGMMLGLPCAFRSFPAATHLGILLYVFRLTRMCSKNTPVRAVTGVPMARHVQAHGYWSIGLRRRAPSTAVPPITAVPPPRLQECATGWTVDHTANPPRCVVHVVVLVVVLVHGHAGRRDGALVAHHTEV